MTLDPYSPLEVNPVDDNARVVAVCDRCGENYAAKEHNDGNSRPIGAQACSCGCETFHELR